QSQLIANRRPMSGLLGVKRTSGTGAPGPPFMGTRPSATMRPRVVFRVLPPALSHRLIVLAGALTPIGRLGVPVALEKKAEAPVVAARNADIDRRPAHQETTLGLVVEHRDELGVIVGLAAQRLVRDDDRGSRQCSRRDAIEHIL